ncbi:MAG: hypothetical protein JWQ10_1773 [Herbaspirillum sp.]|nr:hypothetical protein [Herbaspirillum sp.]
MNLTFAALAAGGTAQAGASVHRIHGGNLLSGAAYSYCLAERGGVSSYWRRSHLRYSRASAAPLPMRADDGMDAGLMAEEMIAAHHAQRGVLRQRGKAIVDPRGLAWLSGMGEVALRRNPVAGLQALHSRFGVAPGHRKQAGSVVFSAHPVQAGDDDLAQWARRSDSALALQSAVQALVEQLLAWSEASPSPPDVIAGFSLRGALSRRLNPAAIRGAIAAGLRARVNAQFIHGASLSPEQADWIAAVTLCRREAALARNDAPPQLRYGDGPWAQRQLAIANCHAKDRDHWAMRDIDLVVENKRFIGHADALNAVAKSHCHAQALPRPRAQSTEPDCAAAGDAAEKLRSALEGTMVLPPTSEIAGTLMPDWLERIDWQAFDGAGFLQEHGALLPPPDAMSWSWWMTALHDYFEPQPQPTLKSAPFNVGNMHPARLRQFADRLIRSQGYGAVAAGALSPFFLQTLFDGWLRLSVLPLVAGPFQLFLSDAARPQYASRCGAAAAVEPDLPPLLRSVAAVKIRLRDQLFADADPACTGALKQWIFDALCSLLLPALGRNDLPDDMIYGGLEWTMLDMATSLLGDSHWAYTPQALILFAYNADIFASADAGGQGQGEAKPHALYLAGAAMRMAHSVGAIDVGGAVDKSMVVKALSLLQRRWSAATGGNDPLNHFEATIPSRIDSARALLMEHGMGDPDREFTMEASLLQRLNFMADTPLQWDRPYPLHQIYMEDGMQQLLDYGDLPASLKRTFDAHRAALTAATLSARFDRDFDASIAMLSDQILIPAWREAIHALPLEEQQFWQCSRWELRIPRAQLRTYRPWSGAGVWTGQAFDVYALEHPTVSYVASGAVLIDLYGKDGATRHYWASFKPFRLQRYDGDVAALLQENLAIFFKPRKQGERMLALSDWPALSYSRRNADTDAGVPGGVLAAITRQLLIPVLGPLRQAARGVTDTEAHREQVASFFLNLLPFYSCVSALKSKDNIDSAGFLCTLDMAGLMPLIGAGGKAVATIVRTSAVLSRKEIKSLASAFMGRGILYKNAANTIATTLQIAAPLKNLARQTVFFLDPGVGMGWGFSKFVASLGKQGARALALKMKTLPALRGLRKELNQQRRQGQLFFQDRAFWLARHAKIEYDAGERYLQHGGKRYGVMAIGDSPDVLVLRDGRGVRLADPVSGLTYGPLLRRDGARLRRIEAGAAGDAKDAALATADRGAARVLPPHCRAKRSPEAKNGNCMLRPALKFGQHFYQFEPGSMDWLTHQLHPLDRSASGRLSRLKPVDPASAGYCSYSYVDGEIKEMNYFIWGKRLWERRSGGKVEMTPWEVNFPDQLSGHFMHTAAPYLEDGHIYIQVDFPVGHPETGMTFRNTHVVPYGSYAMPDGTRMGMVEIGGEFYTFKMSGTLPRPAESVAMVKASEELQDIYHTYYQINNAELSSSIVGKVIRLKECAPEFQVLIGRGLNRAESMIADARAFLAAEPGTAEALLRRFVPGHDPAAAAVLRGRIAADFRRLEQAMGPLQQNKNRLLGFASMSDGSADAVVGMSLPHSLRYDIDPLFTNKPVIYLDPNHVIRSSRDTLAADIVHELTHARLGTFDSFPGEALEEVYVLSGKAGHVDIANLIAAAQRPGNDPGAHAATLENLVVLFAYKYRGDSRADDIFSGRSTIYQRNPV